MGNHRGASNLAVIARRCVWRSTTTFLLRIDGSASSLHAPTRAGAFARSSTTTPRRFPRTGSAPCELRIRSTATACRRLPGNANRGASGGDDVHPESQKRILFRPARLSELAPNVNYVLSDTAAIGMIGPRSDFSSVAVWERSVGMSVLLQPLRRVAGSGARSPLRMTTTSAISWTRATAASPRTPKSASGISTVMISSDRMMLWLICAARGGRGRTRVEWGAGRGP